VKAYSTVSLPLSIQASGELRGFDLWEPTSVFLLASSGKTMRNTKNDFKQQQLCSGLLDDVIPFMQNTLVLGIKLELPISNQLPQLQKLHPPLFCSLHEWNTTKLELYYD
jgi:hypothetical protein